MYRGLSRVILLFCLVNISYSIEEEDNFYQDLLIHPMELNTTKISFLNEILKLKEKGKVEFENFRKTNYFTSIYQLTNFGLSISEIDKISPYISVKKLPDESLSFYFRAITREKNNSNQNIFQSELMIKDLRFYYGFETVTNIIELDRSYFFTNSRYNISFENDYLKFVMGHYQLSFGQNLLFGTTSINYIDNIVSYPIQKKTRGIVPYNSLKNDSDNNKIYGYLNGTAVRFNLYNFFPYFSIAEQKDNTNTNYNVTAALVFEDDFSCGFVWNYSTKNTNEYSLFYKFPFWLFTTYGEIANSIGFSIVQGCILRYGNTTLSTLLYYVDTNFNSTTGDEIIDYKMDTKGVFLGFKQNFSSFYFQSYANIFSRVTNELFYQKYEAKTSLNIRDFNFTMELKTRYSDLRTTKNLRSYFYCDKYFFRKKFLVSLRYQNLLEFNRNETGNMYLLRLTLYPFFMKVKGRVLYYKTESYFSSLYYPEEDFYFGDFTLKAYYGEGYEYALYFEAKVRDLTIGCGYSNEKKINIERENYKLALYVEGKW